MNSIHDRDEETAKLLDWGFREFVNRELFKAGDTVSDADVWLGDVATVPLAIASDVMVTVPVPLAQSLEARAVYNGPLPAPIKRGALPWESHRHRRQYDALLRSRSWPPRPLDGWVSSVASRPPPIIFSSGPPKPGQAGQTRGSDGCKPPSPQRPSR